MPWVSTTQPQIAPAPKNIQLKTEYKFEPQSALTTKDA